MAPFACGAVRLSLAARVLSPEREGGRAMALLIRFYEAEADALDARNDLRQRGLRETAAHVISKLEPTAGEAALIQKGVRRENAGLYAARVRSGQTLLIVDAPYGSAMLAHEILDRPRASDTADGHSHHEGADTADDAAPLSAVMGLPVLMHDDPAPLSSFLGIPTLSQQKPSTTDRTSTLANFFPSRIFGPLLTKNGQPLGFGFSLLANDGKAFSFGLPLLTKSQKPLFGSLIKSGKPLGFGLPLLIKSGKPLSFGLPLLIHTDDDEGVHHHASTP
jgi:hypothetical protein